MEASRCDKTLTEFYMFCDIDCKTSADKFSELDESSWCLDDFYFHKIGIQKYIYLK